MADFNLIRLAWSCRRGMLELDTIIMPFFQQHFNDLSAQDKQTFVEVLDYDDPTLFKCLMNQGSTNNAKHDAMLALMKQQYLNDKK